MPWETVANCINCGCPVVPQPCPGHSPIARRELLVVVTNRSGCECVDGFTDRLFAADVPGFPYQWINRFYGRRRMCYPDETAVDTVLRCDGGSQGPATSTFYEYTAYSFGDFPEHRLYVIGDGTAFGVPGPAGLCFSGKGIEYEPYPLEGFTLIDRPGEPLFIQYRGARICGSMPWPCESENGLIDITIIQDDP